MSLRLWWNLTEKRGAPTSQSPVASRQPPAASRQHHFFANTYITMKTTNHRLTTIALLAATASTDAFSVSGRRNFFGAVSGAAAAVIAGGPQAANAAGKIKTGQANPFTGDYDDPNHPGCLRQVKVVGAPLKADGSRPLYAVVEVTGYDGKDGEKVCRDRPRLEKLRAETKHSLTFRVRVAPLILLANGMAAVSYFPMGTNGPS
jgi:hypothetical protein